MRRNEIEKIRAVLNLPEIRSGRFDINVLPSVMSSFKLEKRQSLEKEHLLLLKKKLNNFHILLNKFSEKDVQFSDKYLIEILNIAEIPFLNWEEIIRKTEALNKPNTSVLRWSYYNIDRKYKQEPKGSTVEKFEPFFQQLKFELKLLATKVKI